MPATFILFSLSLIGITSWLAARWLVRKRRNRDPRTKLERLHTRAAWLEQRLDTAREEHWDRALIVCLSHQLGLACEELARAQQGSRRSTLVSAR